VTPSGRLVVTRDNAKSIRSMRAMVITPWYTGCNDDLPRRLRQEAPCGGSCVSERIDLSIFALGADGAIPPTGDSRVMFRGNARRTGRR